MPTVASPRPRIARKEQAKRRPRLVWALFGLQAAIAAIVIASVAEVAGGGQTAGGRGGASAANAVVVASTTFPQGRFEVRAFDSAGEVCIFGTDLDTGWRTQSRCLAGIPTGSDLVVWPQRDKQGGTTVYYGLARGDVRWLTIEDDRGRRMTVPTQSGDSYRGRLAGEVTFVALRIQGDRRLRDVAALR